MNIFGTFENLITFPAFNSNSNFNRVAKEARKELGEKKYLLNKYISEVLNISNQIDIKFALYLADKICSDILNNCFKIVYADSAKGTNEYLSLVEKYINENPINIDDPYTKVKYYATKILLNHLEIFAEDFFKSIKEKFKNIDFSKLNDYYKEMARILSECQMEYLNDLIYETFFMCPVGVAFISQITSKCAEILTYHDDGTSKQVFEFMLED